MHADGKNELHRLQVGGSPAANSRSFISPAATRTVDGVESLSSGFGSVRRRWIAGHAREQVGHRRVLIALQLVAVTLLVEKDPCVTVFGVKQVDQRAHRSCQQVESGLDGVIENVHVQEYRSALSREVRSTARTRHFRGRPY